jgi:hypothetical protein
MTPQRPRLIVRLLAHPLASLACIALIVPSLALHCTHPPTPATAGKAAVTVADDLCRILAPDLPAAICDAIGDLRPAVERVLATGQPTLVAVVEKPGKHKRAKGASSVGIALVPVVPGSSSAAAMGSAAPVQVALAVIPLDAPAASVESAPNVSAAGVLTLPASASPSALRPPPLPPASASGLRPPPLPSGSR